MLAWGHGTSRVQGESATGTPNVLIVLLPLLVSIPVDVDVTPLVCTDTTGTRPDGPWPAAAIAAAALPVQARARIMTALPRPRARDSAIHCFHMIVQYVSLLVQLQFSRSCGQATKRGRPDANPPPLRRTASAPPVRRLSPGTPRALPVRLSACPHLPKEEAQLDDRMIYAAYSEPCVHHTPQAQFGTLHSDLLTASLGVACHVSPGAMHLHHDKEFSKECVEIREH